MLVVETIAKIRRAYFVQKKAIQENCRELKVSRKTVRRVVRSGATEFVYERKMQPQPKFCCRTWSCLHTTMSALRT